VSLRGEGDVSEVKGVSQSVSQSVSQAVSQSGSQSYSTTFIFENPRSGVLWKHAEAEKSTHHNGKKKILVLMLSVTSPIQKASANEYTRSQHSAIVIVIVFVFVPVIVQC
jgi:hypothetical protein